MREPRILGTPSCFDERPDGSSTRVQAYFVVSAALTDTDCPWLCGKFWKDNKWYSLQEDVQVAWFQTFPASNPSDHLPTSGQTSPHGMGQSRLGQTWPIPFSGNHQEHAKCEGSRTSSHMKVKALIVLNGLWLRYRTYSHAPSGLTRLTSKAASLSERVSPCSMTLLLGFSRA